MLDQTASAKIVAMWGIDYMHLAKYDGRWQIINIVWQAHPPKALPTPRDKTSRRLQVAG